MMNGKKGLGNDSYSKTIYRRKSKIKYSRENEEWLNVSHLKIIVKSVNKVVDERMLKWFKWLI